MLSLTGVDSGRIGTYRTDAATLPEAPRHRLAGQPQRPNRRCMDTNPGSTAAGLYAEAVCLVAAASQQLPPRLYGHAGLSGRDRVRVRSASTKAEPVAVDLLLLSVC